ERNGRLFFAEQCYHLVIDNFDQLLTWPDRLQGGDSNRFFLHPLEKLTGEVEAHVCFEQDPADFPKTVFDVILGQYTATRQFLKGGGEFRGQLVEHKPSILAGLRAFFKRLEMV